MVRPFSNILHEIRQLEAGFNISYHHYHHFLQFES